MDNASDNYRRFLAGEDEGLTLIIKEYKDGLIMYINSYVNNIYVAEDLMQDTFYKIAVKKPKFKGESTFKTWLYAIGRNIALDYLRKHSKDLFSSMEDMENYIRDEADLEKLYIQNERKKLLHKALITLKAEYRQVLWLVYFEGFSNDQAAQVMGKSKRQIENLIYRAKQSLESALGKEGLEHEEL